MKLNLPQIFSLCLLLGGLAAYSLWPGFQNWINEAATALSSGEVDKVKSFLSDYRDYGYLILIALFILQMFLLIAPSVVVMILAVWMYGPWWGTAINLAGIATAGSIAYVLGAWLGDVSLDQLIGSKMRKKITRFIERYGFWTVAVFRFSPFFSNDAVSFIAGFTEMRFWPFLGATLLGITPLAVLIAIYGQSYQRMETGLIVVGIISLISLVLYIYFDRKN